MSRPLIGITSGEIINIHGSWAPVVYGQSHTYIDAIIHAGGVPVILPLAADESIWHELYERCDGLLFSGGNDVDPSLYGEALDGTKPEDISTFRDTQETALLKLALADDKPILAICRGFQLLNVTLGGTLYQDIPSSLDTASDHEDSTHQKSMYHIAHQLTLESGSKLHELLQVDSIAANSHHHQGVKEIGKGLRVSAHAEDGLVEGLELPDKKFVIAVQSHPESLEHVVEKRWRKLFEAFVNASK